MLLGMSAHFHTSWLLGILDVFGSSLFRVQPMPIVCRILWAELEYDLKLLRQGIEGGGRTRGYRVREAANLGLWQWHPRKFMEARPDALRSCPEIGMPLCARLVLDSCQDAFRDVMLVLYEGAEQNTTTTLGGQLNALNDDLECRACLALILENMQSTSSSRLLPTSHGLFAGRTWETLSVFARLESIFYSQISAWYVRALDMPKAVPTNFSFLGSSEPCEPLVSFEWLAELDSQRLSMMQKYEVTSENSTKQMALSALWFAQACLADVQRRLQWLASPIPVFAMLERATLALVATANPTNLRDLPGISSRVLAEEAGRALRGFSTTKIHLALAPNRETSSDQVRYTGGVACWRGEIHKAVAMVASRRAITEAAPLKMIDIGAAAGDCLLSVAGLLGSSRLNAVGYEPFAPSADRFSWAISANKLQGVHVRRVGISGQPGDRKLCGTVHSQFNFYASVCDDAQTQSVDVTMISLQDALGDKEWDIVSIYAGILEEVFSGPRVSLDKVGWIVVHRCLVRGFLFWSTFSALNLTRCSHGPWFFR